MPLQMIVRLLLKQLLSSQAIKDEVIMVLRVAAAKTDNKLDDSTVDVVEDIWSALAPHTD